MTAAGDNLDRIEALDRLRNLRPKDLTRAEKDALVEIARAAQATVDDAAVDDIDPRLDYVNVQMSRETLPALAAALARLNTKEGT